MQSNGLELDVIIVEHLFHLLVEEICELLFCMALNSDILVIARNMLTYIIETSKKYLKIYTKRYVHKVILKYFI